MNLDQLYNQPVIESVTFIDEIDFEGYKTNWWLEFTGIEYNTGTWSINKESQEYKNKDIFKQHLISGANHDDEYALKLYKYTYDDIPFAFGFGHGEDLRDLSLYITDQNLFDKVKTFLTNVMTPKSYYICSNFVGNDPDLMQIFHQTLNYNPEYNISITHNKLEIIVNE